MGSRALKAGTFVLVAVALTAAGCGGGGDGSAPDLEGRYSSAEVQEAFSAETGEELTVSESEFGGPPRLVFEEDGNPYNLSTKEEEFVGEFGAFTVYVIEQGDPQAEFDLITGESGQDQPSEVGGDTVTYSYEVAPEPDDDGIVWKETCVEYAKEEALNYCYWSGFRQYGENVLVSWQSESGEADRVSDNIDGFMSRLPGQS